MEQNPVPNHIAQQNADDNHDIGYQDQIDKIHIAGLNTHIDNRFRNKGQKSLQDRNDKHYKKQVQKTLFVRRKITQKILQRFCFS